MGLHGLTLVSVTSSLVPCDAHVGAPSLRLVTPSCRFLCVAVQESSFLVTSVVVLMTGMLFTSKGFSSDSVGYLLMNVVSAVGIVGVTLVFLCLLTFEVYRSIKVGAVSLTHCCHTVSQSLPVLCSSAPLSLDLTCPSCPNVCHAPWQWLMSLSCQQCPLLLRPLMPSSWSIAAPSTRTAHTRNTTHHRVLVHLSLARLVTLSTPHDVAPHTVPVPHCAVCCHPRRRSGCGGGGRGGRAEGPAW